MSLAKYFAAPYTEWALDRYVAVVPQNWSVAHKLDLYRSAKTAFDSDAPEGDKQDAFRHIYDSLRSYWQVFRPKSADECWSSDQIFAAFTNECQPCSRQSGLTLATLKDRNKGSIDLCLSKLGKMKPTEQYPAVYPWMAVAKFSHFFNPHLFAIYDDAFMWKKVANGAFKKDYTDFCHRRGFQCTENTSRFNLQYTLWSAELIQAADENCMTTFSEWFASQVNHENASIDILMEIGEYYAAAFEMIAIGAAQLEC